MYACVYVHKYVSDYMSMRKNMTGYIPGCYHGLPAQVEVWNKGGAFEML